MVMFLGSEAMLFGSFFTAFFFLRFTSATWPTDGITLPVGSHRHQHRDPDQLVLHDALGAGLGPPQQPLWAGARASV